MAANIERELESIRNRLLAEHRADVAGAIDLLDAAREAIEQAHAALEAAEALAIFFAHEVDERLDAVSLDLGTDELVTALIAIGDLARI